MITISEQWDRVLRELRDYGTTKNEWTLNDAQYEYKIYKLLGGKRIENKLEYKKGVGDK